MGTLEIKAPVPVNAVIFLQYRERSGVLGEGAAAISSLCRINAIILCQRSLGITFYAKGFAAYFLK